ncbi:hypothetical protein MMC28_010344 [Mycoblastus sanguinarius]|nr:hypothetical protein [Mycoblastus sanguinarius]
MDTGSASSSLSDGLTTLREQISELQCCNVEGKLFVPEGTLDQVLTTATVQSAVHQCGLYSYSHLGYKKLEIVRAVIPGGRKVFAILVLMNKLDLIAKFAESDTLQGANVDSKLPYERSALHSIFSGPGTDRFYHTQWMFAVPHFRRGMGHLHLSDETIMPIIDIQIQGYRGLSDVSLLTFHPNHSDFAVSSSKEGQPQQMATLETPDPGLAPRNPRAIRKLYQKSKKDLNFSRESSVLSVLNRLEQPSIIQLLGSYSFQNTENLLLSPFSGDLSQMLAKEDPPSAFRCEADFLFALCGLSSAIDTLHNTTSDGLGRNLIGIHKDIKPRNILVDEERFVLTDFALSELSIASDGDETDFASGGDEYAAPECLIGEDFKIRPISRSSDIWSFGCVIAEVATYIYSAESTYGVDRFRLKRKIKIGNGIITTYAFHAGSIPNPGVADWLTELKTKATPVGIELVNLVIGMLQMEPALRPRATEVTSRLHVLALSSQAQSTDEAYTKVAEILSDTDVVVYRIRFRLLMRITGLIDRTWPEPHIFDSGLTFNQWKVLLQSIAEHLTGLLVKPDLWNANPSRLSSLNDELTSALPSSLQENLPPRMGGNVDANARDRSYIQDWDSSGATDTSSTSSKVSGWSRGQEGSMEHTLESSVEQKGHLNLEDSSQEHERGEDTQSVLSDQNDINSQKSSRRHPREVTAEDHLTILLAKHDELCPLYEEALSKIGSGRFVNNFRRLLEICYLDLLRNAETNLERATINLMKSRWSRTRIAQRIVDIHKPESHSAREQIERHAEEVKKRIPDFHDWLVEMSLAAPVSQVEPAVNTDDVSDRDQSSDDENDTLEEEHAEDSEDVISLPHIKEMETFVMEGSAFQNLVTNLRVFLLPAALRPLNRVLMSIPSDRIWLSIEDDLSISNTLKAIVEGLTEENWNWWPLRGKMRVLRKD